MTKAILATGTLYVVVVIAALTFLVGYEAGKSEGQKIVYEKLFLGEIK
jgi:hypothetical protein